MQRSLQHQQHDQFDPDVMQQQAVFRPAAPPAKSEVHDTFFFNNRLYLGNNNGNNFNVGYTNNNISNRELLLTDIMG